MSKILGKLFGKAGGSVVDKLAGVADRFIRTKDEKAEFEKQMTQIFIDAEAAMQKNVTERWKADLEHGNWLTRSVRPLVLVFLIPQPSLQPSQHCFLFYLLFFQPLP